MKRVLTLHLDKFRLTPEIVEILAVVSSQLEKPDMRIVSDGLAIYVHDYSRLV